MKSIIAICFGLLCNAILPASAQERYTPYDEIPGVIKSYKPAWDENMPKWAKLLYELPINFNQISQEYIIYMKNHPDEESPLIRYYKNWALAVSPYVKDDGTIYLPNMAQYKINLLVSKTIKDRQTTENESDWSFLGPKETFLLNEQGSPVAPPSCPWQANVYSLDVAPSNHNIVYCGTETAFMNKTTDKGLNWQQIGRDYAFGGGITAIVVHPYNPNIVYAAGGWQIHKSIDGGITWQPMLPLENMFYADRLRIDQMNPEKIIAASASGLFISTNGGTSWEQRSSLPCYDIEIKPNNSDILYGLTRSGTYFSLIISQDGGNTFQTESNFPTSIVEYSGGLLAVTPDNPNVIFAIMLSTNRIPYLAKGTLINSTWQWAIIATGLTSQFPMDIGQGYFDLILEVSPVDQNLILTGTTSLYKSVNGGMSFTCIGGYCGGFGVHPDIQDVKMLPDGDTWVSTDGGMNLTTDCFSNLTNHFPRVNGLMGSHMWGFDQGWNEDIVVGGRYHNGNTAIADFYQPKALRMGGGESPTGWVLQGKSRQVAFNDLGNGWILPLIAEGVPEGRFNFSKYPNMDEYGGLRGNLVHHPNYYGTLYLGEENSFFRSTDAGSSYELLYTFQGRVRYLQISMSNPDVIYADIVGFGLYRSSDGGLSWIPKPTLTNGTYGNSYWAGKLFFVISPYNENVIYACLQNGSWSNDWGLVFRSSNGGDTWENWSGTVNDYLKCMAIQPTAENVDLVYLFTHNGNGVPAKVYYRKEGMNDWADFSNGYPYGMQVNMALPFYRDSKLRVAGTGSIWESPLQEPEFTPIINPWVEKQHYNCMTDTIFFEDHSILNHNGATWHWEINPQPLFISNPNIRNPKVVVGAPGSYSVTLTVTKNGQSWSRTISGMFTATTCPSIDDCSNPVVIPKDIWSLIYVDSEEPSSPAVNSFDNQLNTGWHTRWSAWVDPYPHEIQISMGRTYNVFSLIYNNSDLGFNGRIKEYELYLSSDSLQSGVQWGDPVAEGEFINTTAPQYIYLDEPVIAKYFKLRALSEVNGGPWTSSFEFSIVGCNLTKSFDLDLNLEGLYNSSSGYMNKALGRDFPSTIADEITVSLARNTFPYTIAYTKYPVFLDQNGTCHLEIPSDIIGEYYIVIKHRNSIETWSANPLSFEGTNIAYDFTTDANKAYGENMKLTGSEYSIFGGDVNQDGFVDTGDMSPVDNDANNFTTGYISTDADGNGMVDTGDMTIIDNNASNFIGAIVPSPLDLPVVTTATISEITFNSAVCGGQVLSQGGSEVIARGVCWSLSSNPSIADSHSFDGTGTGPYVSAISGLLPGTIYHLCAYASNSFGTSYGEILSITTLMDITNTVTDIDGNVYQTINIGTQTWMAENLKVIHYRNGDPIPNYVDNSQWYNQNSGAYCWYNNDEITYKNTYGALYNWFTVIDYRSLCPNGWHIPSDDEWLVLTSYLGGEDYAGGTMKSMRTEPEPHPRWDAPNLGATNQSGFSGLPGGARILSGIFYDLGFRGFWWSSAEFNSSLAWGRFLICNYDFLHLSEYEKESGFSVRCLRD